MQKSINRYQRPNQNQNRHYLLHLIQNHPRQRQNPLRQSQKQGKRRKVKNVICRRKSNWQWVKVIVVL